MVAEPMQRTGEQPADSPAEKRNLLSVAHTSAVGSRCGAWRIVTSAEQKKGLVREFIEKATDLQRLEARAYAMETVTLHLKQLKDLKAQLCSEIMKQERVQPHTGERIINGIVEVVKLALQERVRQRIDGEGDLLRTCF